MKKMWGVLGSLQAQIKLQHFSQHLGHQKQADPNDEHTGLLSIFVRKAPITYLPFEHHPRLSHET